MKEVLLLVAAKLRSGELDSLRAVGDHLREELCDAPGFRGVTLWRCLTSKGRHLITAETGGSDDPNVTAVQDLALADAIQRLQEPARVLRLDLIERHGPLLIESPMGSFLSTSDRIAEPGMAKELVRDLRTVFDELRLMDGCLGTQVYQNEALEEEMVGLVSWSKKEAFERSLPRRQPYVVRLYDRIG